MDIIENRICVSLGNISYQECLAAVKKYPLCEVRLDLFDFSEGEMEAIFKAGNKLVVSCRPGKYSDAERKKMLLAAINSRAAYVDIELESKDQFKKEIISEAQRQKCQVIISYHNYEYTPAKNYLERMAQFCFEKGADLAKIACLIIEQNDLTKLYQLYRCFNPIIAFGMGELGKESRLKCLEMGAEFSYASLNPEIETAPGQMSFDEMVKIASQNLST